MKITRCHICDKPFFPNPSTTDFAQGFDPNACPQCNANAIKNSQIVDNKTYSIAQAIAEDRARVNVIIQNILLAVESSAHKNEKGEDVVYAGQVNRLMGEVDDLLFSLTS